AAVEKSGRHPQLPGRDPRDRGDLGAERGDRDLHRGIEIHRIVLEVEKQPVVAAGFHDRRDVDRARLAQDDPERQLAGIEPLLRGILQNNGHQSLLAQLARAILRDDDAPVTRRSVAPRIPLSALGGGEGWGEVGDSRALADTHLTCPFAARWPLPPPPEGAWHTKCCRSGARPKPAGP